MQPVHAAPFRAALSPARIRAITYLAEAQCTAEEMNRPPWEFACQLTTLLTWGVSESVLRWLLGHALIEHRLEITRSGARRRRFRPTTALQFRGSSCFVLTRAGVELASCEETTARPGAAVDWRPDGGQPALRPHYDLSRRTLFFAGQVIKQFRVPAENQELILRAFEEEAWPARLDDPLPPLHGIDKTKRLQDATYRLNNCQVWRLLRFEGDGQGIGIQWRRIDGGSTES